MANAEGLSRAWETKALSDSVIVFSDLTPAVRRAVQAHMHAAEQEGDPTPAKKKAKTGRGKQQKQAAEPASREIAPPAWPARAVVIEAHSLQLLAASKVFEKQLLDHAELGADHQLCLYSKDGRSKRRVVLVGVEDAALLDAAEPLMRLVYSQPLPADISTQPEKLLQIYQLADQVEATGCMSACTAALAAVPIENLQPSHINFVLQLFHDTQLASTSGDLQRLQANCEARLMQSYGDACKVIKDQSAGGLRQQFGSLPFPALLHWVKSEQLATDSENTIMALLHYWRGRQVHNSRSSAAIAAQMEQLAAHVRVPLLSPLFSPGEFLPVPWFQPRTKLHHALLAKAHQAREFDVERLQRSDIGCPPAWFSKQPRPRSPTAVSELCVEVTEAQIKQGIESAKAGKTVWWDSPVNFIMGFEVGFSLQLVLRNGAVALGGFLKVLGGWSGNESEDGHLPVYVLADISFAAAQGGAAQAHIKSLQTFLGKQSGSRGFWDHPKPAPINAASDLAPWIKAGKMTAAAVLRQIDGLDVSQPAAAAAAAAPARAPAR